MATTAPLAALRLPCMVACALVLAACQPAQSLQDARDTLASGLPAPYFEDLVTESATIEGNRLVLLVRSPEGDAEKTRRHERFDQLRDSERLQMQDLCELPAIQPLRATDAVLVRRFVDRKGALFFEVEFPARDCTDAEAIDPFMGTESGNGAPLESMP